MFPFYKCPTDICIIRYTGYVVSDMKQEEFYYLILLFNFYYK